MSSMKKTKSNIREFDLWSRKDETGSKGPVVACIRNMHVT